LVAIAARIPAMSTKLTRPAKLAMRVCAGRNTTKIASSSSVPSVDKRRVVGLNIAR